MCEACWLRPGMKSLQEEKGRGLGARWSEWPSLWEETEGVRPVHCDPPKEREAAEERRPGPASPLVPRWQHCLGWPGWRRGRGVAGPQQAECQPRWELPVRAGHPFKGILTDVHRLNEWLTVRCTECFSSKKILLKNCYLKPFWGFPGGAVVKNPPANAGDTGSSPGPGRSRMPRSNSAPAPQLLSLRSRACEPKLLSPPATTTGARLLQLLKPACLEPLLCNKRSHCSEQPVHCNKE